MTNYTHDTEKRYQGGRSRPGLVEVEKYQRERKGLGRVGRNLGEGSILGMRISMNNTTEWGAGGGGEGRTVTRLTANYSGLQKG